MVSGSRVRHLSVFWGIPATEWRRRGGVCPRVVDRLRRAGGRSSPPSTRTAPLGARGNTKSPATTSLPHIAHSTPPDHGPEHPTFVVGRLFQATTRRTHLRGRAGPGRIQHTNRRRSKGNSSKKKKKRPNPPVGNLLLNSAKPPFVMDRCRRTGLRSGAVLVSCCIHVCITAHAQPTYLHAARLPPATKNPPTLH